jgi:hypothetical protein
MSHSQVKVKDIVQKSDVYYPTELTTWLLGEDYEEKLIEVELGKTVTEYIVGFKKLIVHLCRFDHERADRLRSFVDCSLFWLNMVCGHPRVIRAKFKIAYLLLRHKTSISKEEMEEYQDRLYEHTGPLTDADFRATSGYRNEHLDWLIQENSPTGEKMSVFQQEFWVKLAALRDEIIQKLEAVFVT